MRLCKIRGCGKIHFARDFCKPHYNKWYIENMARKCEIGGCDSYVNTLNMCAKHVHRLKRNGDPHKRKTAINKGKICIVDECDQDVRAIGKYCNLHYRRFKKYGDPTVTYYDIKEIRKCKVSYCDEKHSGYGFCQFHRRLMLFYQEEINLYDSRLEDVYGESPYICYLCGEEYQELTANDFEMDHIIPISRGGMTVKDNIQISCVQCNRCKQRLTDKEFILLCETVAKYRGKN